MAPRDSGRIRYSRKSVWLFSPAGRAPEVPSALQRTYLDPERLVLGRQLNLRRFPSAIGQALIFAASWSKRA